MSWLNLLTRQCKQTIYNLPKVAKIVRNDVSASACMERHKVEAPNYVNNYNFDTYFSLYMGNYIFQHKH